MAPQVHLSYDKQLTTADQFFGKIYKLFLSQSAKLEHEKACIVQNLKNRQLQVLTAKGYNLKRLGKITYRKKPSAQ